MSSSAIVSWPLMPPGATETEWFRQYINAPQRYLGPAALSVRVSLVSPDRRGGIHAANPRKCGGPISRGYKITC
jgi:hypothetical protein